jgi:dTDP-4-amino-4,6-dideoxygalactose transaminase
MSDSTDSPGPLAVDGGTAVVATPIPRRQRWGQVELTALTEMVDQESLFYWNGPQTTAMLDRFRQTYPLEHCMPCSSGSAAIHIAIAALKLEPGSEVIVPAITDMGSVIGILYQQLVPVFADVEPDTINLDPADVKRRITPKTRAIMPVHLAGCPCNMGSLMGIAREFNLRVVEDCAQAWGTRWQGQFVGQQGDFACFSFNEFKHLSCGDGGIAATNDDELAQGLSKWGDKHYDRVKGGRSPETLSPNYRITEPQSAVALGQLAKHDDLVAHRIQLGRILRAGLAPIPGVQLQPEREGDTHSSWFGMLRFDLTQFRVDRDTLVAALLAEGVAGEGGYLPSPVYGYPVFQNHDFFAGRWPLKDAGLTAMDYREASCPVAEAVLADCMTLVINEAVPRAYMEQVVSAFRKVCGHYSIAVP